MRGHATGRISIGERKREKGLEKKKRLRKDVRESEEEKENRKSNTGEGECKTRYPTRGGDSTKCNVEVRHGIVRTRRRRG